MGGVRYTQYVPTLTLDSLLHSFSPPQLIKIDVEGAEELVLQGATKVLTVCRPSVYLEVGSQQARSLLQFLRF